MNPTLAVSRHAKNDPKKVAGQLKKNQLWRSTMFHCVCDLRILSGLFGVVMLMSSEIASAGIIVTVGNVVVRQGDSVHLDILARSDLAAGESLEAFNAEFHVAPDPEVATVFNITSIPDISEELEYVFAGTSLGFNGAILDEQFDKAIVGDFGYAWLDTTPRLLARLELAPGVGFLAPTAGDSFRIELSPSFGDSSGLVSGVSDTGFLRFDIDLDLHLIPVPVPYESSSGSIQVSGGVVPEPASIATWALGLACLCWYRSRRSLPRSR